MFNILIFASLILGVVIAFIGAFGNRDYDEPRERKRK